MKGKRDFIFEFKDIKTDYTNLKKIVEKELKVKGVKYSDNVKCYFNLSEQGRIMQVAIIGGGWIVFTIVGYVIYKANSSQDKLRVMSCRNTLKKYKKLDESDNKSLF